MPRFDVNQADGALATWPACASIRLSAMAYNQLTDRTVRSEGTPSSLQERISPERIPPDQFVGRLAALPGFKGCAWRRALCPGWCS